jgi:hypothetical protein
MSQLAIVNAPSSFTAIWAVMRPWLAKETVAKVAVLGSNYQSALLEMVPAENLPETLGGTCTCEDCGAHSDGSKAGAHADEKAEKAGAKKGEKPVGVAEMGRCAFSSAGPWMVGREERRAAWLRGERRDIGLYPGEYATLLEKEKARGQAQDTVAGEKPAESQAEEAMEESSEDASAGPSTPGVDSVQQQQLDQIAIKDDAEHEHGHTGGAPARRLSPEESVQLIAEKHPETRLVQNGDLHVH